VGRYELRISGRSDGGRLIVGAAGDGPRAATREEEPNNQPDQAFAFDPAQPLTGRLIGSTSIRDADILALELDGAWRDRRFDLVLRADAGGELGLGLLDDSGLVIQERTGTGEVRLPGLSLEPGRHLVRVYGALDPATTYALAVEDAAPLAAGVE